jgi:hypothetical protein
MTSRLILEITLIIQKVEVSSRVLKGEGKAGGVL